MYILYEGYSPVYFSNIQGVLLPGFFPYYPKEGYHPVYYAEKSWIDGHNTQYLGIGQKDFEVTVNSLRMILSAFSY